MEAPPLDPLTDRANESPSESLTADFFDTIKSFFRPADTCQITVYCPFCASYVVALACGVTFAACSFRRNHLPNLLSTTPIVCFLKTYKHCQTIVTTGDTQ